MTDLLSRRMLAQRLDRLEIARIEPTTFLRLEAVCTSCTAREECELGLANDFSDVGWHAYCPNAAALKALGELRWFELAVR